MNPYCIPPFISFALLLSCAFYILKKGAGRIFNRLFAFAVFALSSMELGNFAALVSPSPEKALFWQRWVFASAAFLPVSWAGVSLIFARENYRASLRKWIWYLWLNLIITLGFLFTIPKESLLKASRVHSFFTLGSAGRCFLIFFLLNAVFSLLNFENTLSFSYGKHRGRIKWMVRGFSLYLWAYIILSSLALLFSRVDARLSVIGSAAIISGALFCGYSVYKYGFVDVDVYVGRQAAYASATITAAGAYLFLVGLAAKLFMLWGVNVKSFLSFLSAFLAFFIFLCLVLSKNIKERLRIFIDRAIYKGKYDYREEWAQISGKINSAFGLKDILSAVTRACAEAISVKNASILLLNDEKGYFSLTASGALNAAAPRDARFDKDSEFADWLSRYGDPLILKMFSERPDTRGIYEKEKKKLEELKTEVIIPIAAKQRLIGMLCAGEKASGEPFTGEDLELFKRIAEQAGIAILNAQLSEELILSKEMESFYKVSSFLIHDLKNFSSALSMVAQNAKDNFDKPEFQKDALSAITSTVGRMNELMQKLSILPKGLELKLGSTDLNYVITQALAKSGAQEARRIKLVKALNGIPRVTADGEYMEKVFLNLILNAIEAMPEGGEISISSRRDEKFVELSIGDTGCGITDEFIDKQLFKPFQSTKKKGLGIGLFQCKTIIEAHQGRMDVHSSPGEGTTFTLRLPINRD